MVGQYFKRRREAVEIALVGSSGIGLALMTVFLHTTLGYKQLFVIFTINSIFFLPLKQSNWMAFGFASSNRFSSHYIYTRFVLQIRIVIPSATKSHSPFEESTKKGFEMKKIEWFKKIVSPQCVCVLWSVQIKEKNKHEEKPPFFDFSSLKSRTMQTIMISTASIAAGLYTPLIYLVKINDSTVISISFDYPF